MSDAATREWGQLRSRRALDRMLSVVADRVLCGWVFGAPHRRAGEWVWPMSRRPPLLWHDPDADEDPRHVGPFSGPGSS